MKALLSVCALAMVVVACDVKRVEESPPADTASPPSTAKTTPATTPSPAPGAAPKADPIEDEIAALTNKWNDALAKRDAKALEGIYASNVRLYTVEMPREKAVKQKAAAFEAAKDYTQSISIVEFDTRKKDAPQALFNKKWTQNGAEKQVRGSLVFAKEGGRWVIKEESDAPSDARRMRAAKDADSCESVVQKLAASTPEALRILQQRSDPAKGLLSTGTRLGGGPPEQSNYSVAIHENHTDHIVTLMWIDVDPKTGAMVSTLDDKPLKGAQDLVDKVKTVCK